MTQKKEQGAVLDAQIVLPSLKISGGIREALRLAGWREKVDGYGKLLASV